MSSKVSHESLKLVMAVHTIVLTNRLRWRCKPHFRILFNSTTRFYGCTLPDANPRMHVFKLLLVLKYWDYWTKIREVKSNNAGVIKELIYSNFYEASAVPAVSYQCVWRDYGVSVAFWSWNYASKCNNKTCLDHAHCSDAYPDEIYL